MSILDVDCGLEHTIAVVKPGKLMAWGHAVADGTAGADGTFMMSSERAREFLCACNASTDCADRRK